MQKMLLIIYVDRKKKEGVEDSIVQSQSFLYPGLLSVSSPMTHVEQTIFPWKHMCSETSTRNKKHNGPRN